MSWILWSFSYLMLMRLGSFGVKCNEPGLIRIKPTTLKFNSTHTLMKESFSFNFEEILLQSIIVKRG